MVEPHNGNRSSTLVPQQHQQRQPMPKSRRRRRRRLSTSEHDDASLSFSDSLSLSSDDDPKSSTTAANEEQEESGGGGGYSADGSSSGQSSGETATPHQLMAGLEVAQPNNNDGDGDNVDDDDDRSSSSDISSSESCGGVQDDDDDADNDDALRRSSTQSRCALTMHETTPMGLRDDHHQKERELQLRGGKEMEDDAVAAAAIRQQHRRHNNSHQKKKNYTATRNYPIDPRIDLSIVQTIPATDVVVHHHSAAWTTAGLLPPPPPSHVTTTMVADTKKSIPANGYKNEPVMPPPQLTVDAYHHLMEAVRPFFQSQGVELLLPTPATTQPGSSSLPLNAQFAAATSSSPKVASSRVATSAAAAAPTASSTTTKVDDPVENATRRRYSCATAITTQHDMRLDPNRQSLPRPNDSVVESKESTISSSSTSVNNQNNELKPPPNHQALHPPEASHRRNIALHHHRESSSGDDDVGTNRSSNNKNNASRPHHAAPSSSGANTQSSHHIVTDMSSLSNHPTSSTTTGTSGSGSGGQTGSGTGSNTGSGSNQGSSGSGNDGKGSSEEQAKEGEDNSGDGTHGSDGSTGKNIKVTTGSSSVLDNNTVTAHHNSNANLLPDQGHHNRLHPSLRSVAAIETIASVGLRERKLLDKKRKRIEMRREYEALQHMESTESSSSSSSDSDFDGDQFFRPGRPVTLDQVVVVSTIPRIVVQGTPPFLVVHTNAAYGRMTGTDSHLVVGKPISELLVILDSAQSGNEIDAPVPPSADSEPARKNKGTTLMSLERLIATSGFGRGHTVHVYAHPNHEIAGNKVAVVDTEATAALATCSTSVTSSARREGPNARRSCDVSAVSKTNGTKVTLPCRVCIAPIVSSDTTVASGVSIENIVGSFLPKPKRGKHHHHPGQARHEPHQGHLPHHNTAPPAEPTMNLPPPTKVRHNHHRYVPLQRVTHFVLQLQPEHEWIRRNCGMESLSSNSTSVAAHLLGLSPAELQAQRAVVSAPHGGAPSNFSTTAAEHDDAEEADLEGSSSVASSSSEPDAVAAVG